MKKIALALAFASLHVPALAAAPKTYQATGPVLELSDDTITIDKGKEGKWEIARTPDTKVTGELKKGAKVTVQYRMTATSIEAKPAAAGAKKGGK